MSKRGLFLTIALIAVVTALVTLHLSINPNTAASKSPAPLQHRSSALSFDPGPDNSINSTTTASSTTILSSVPLVAITPSNQTIELNQSLQLQAYTTGFVQQSAFLYLWNIPSGLTEEPNCFTPLVYNVSQSPEPWTTSSNCTIMGNVVSSKPYLVGLEVIDAGLENEGPGHIITNIFASALNTTNITVSNSTSTTTSISTSTTILTTTTTSSSTTTQTTTSTSTTIPTTTILPSPSLSKSIIITNYEDTPTAPDFQQMIKFNPSSYQSYEANDLGNIRFYQSGNELYSWCESGCTSYSINSIFWVMLPSGLSANSNTLINMTFFPTNTEYDGIYAGEAPQLSEIYAQYDNGANVFPLSYTNFNGTTCPSNWECFGNFSINNSGMLSNGILDPRQVLGREWASNYTFDIYANTTNVTNPAEGVSEGIYTPLTIGGLPATVLGFSTCNATTICSGFLTAPVNQWSVETVHPELWVWPTIEPIVVDSQVNYKPHFYAEVSTPTYNRMPNILQEIINDSGGANITVQWARLRTSPPNGVMPTVSFEPTQNSTTTTSTSSLTTTSTSTTTLSTTTTIPLSAPTTPIVNPSNIDLGQSVAISTSENNGIAPYTYNFIIANSIDYSILASSGPTTSNTYVYTPTNAGTFYSNVTTTDSANLPETQYSANSNTFTVNLQPMISLFPQTNTIYAGQSVTFTNITSGGAGSVAYTYFVSPLSGVTITSNTITFADAGTYNVIETVIDRLGSIAYSANSVITIIPPTTATFTPLISQIDRNQIETYIISVNGGTGPFNVRLYNVTSGTFTGYSTTIKSPGGSGGISFPIDTNAITSIPLTYNAVIIDQGSTPRYRFSTISNTIIVYPQLGSGLVEIPNTVDVGNKTPINISWTGGVSPYKYTSDIINLGNVILIDGPNATNQNTVNTLFSPPGNTIGIDEINTIITDKTYQSGGPCDPLNGCESFNASLTVIPAPTISVNSSSTAVDEGQSVTFTNVTTGIGPFTYSYSTTGGILSGNTITFPTAGTYNVIETVTDYIGDTKTTNAVIITVNQLPKLSIIPQSKVIDGGESVIFSNTTILGTAPFTYAYTINPMTGVETHVCGTEPTYIKSLIRACIPINIVNTQPVQTPSGFEQIFNDTPFNAVAGNVIVYNGISGALVPSWVESNSTIWVNLDANTIGALSSANGVYYFGLGNSSTNFFVSGNQIGEAPQLSSIYAQYDNGNQIFNFYDNFSGTSPKNKWTVFGGGVTINNGLTVTGTGCPGTGIFSSTSFSSNTVFQTDAYINSGVGWEIGLVGAIPSVFGCNSGGNYGFLARNNNFAYKVLLYTPSGPVITDYNLNGIYNIYQIAATPSSATSMVNYADTDVATGNALGTFDAFSSYSFTSDVTVGAHYVLNRAYPPNGIMPTTTYGSPQQPDNKNGANNITFATPESYIVMEKATDNVGVTASSYNSVITVNQHPTATFLPFINPIDGGEIETYQITVNGGTGPFNIKLYNVTSGAFTGYSTTIKSPGDSGGIAFFVGTNANAPTTFTYNAVITDEGTTSPHYTFSSAPNTITVYPPLGSSLSAVPNVTDAGNNTTITASWHGGIPPYAYTFNIINTNNGDVVFTEGPNATGFNTANIQFSPGENSIGIDAIHVKITDQTYNMNGTCDRLNGCEVLNASMIVNPLQSNTTMQNSDEGLSTPLKLNQTTSIISSPTSVTTTAVSTTTIHVSSIQSVSTSTTTTKTTVASTSTAVSTTILQGQLNGTTKGGFITGLITFFKNLFFRIQV